MMATGGPFTRRRLATDMAALAAALADGDPGALIQLGAYATKAPTNIAAGSLFTIASPVVVLAIVGEVTTVIQTQANSIKLIFDPSSAGADTDLCAALNVSAAAAGSYLACTGAIADAMVLGVRRAQLQTTPWILEEGTIKLGATATNTGVINWTIFYKALQLGSHLQSATPLIAA